MNNNGTDTGVKDENINLRIEHDTMGEIGVPADKYWGAQTERSLENFKIGKDRMPDELIRAFAILKKAAARANNALSILDDERAEIISEVCGEIIAGKLDGNFPLVPYQTGSGTQTNMNINEVIAHRGNEIAGRDLLHPNDHVNMSQSSNDTFPAAMHMAAYETVMSRLIPAADALSLTFGDLESKYADIIKIGRTHLQDAAPLTLGQEISGWRSMIEHGIKYISEAANNLRELAIGGTAVGTGLNAPEDFGRLAAENISELTNTAFFTAPNRFHSLTSRDAIVFTHGAVKALAADLLKIANDVRMLASGPRCGIGEIVIPANEPGSSIMPGKVNPTQCEALTMVCAQVFGNDTTIGFAASQGNFQLNVYMPVIINDFIESVNLLADAMNSFRIHCASDIRPNKYRIEENLKRSLMLVTALCPHIGYENAANIAKRADERGITLREAALELKLVSQEEFDRWADPAEMTHN